MKRGWTWDIDGWFRCYSKIDGTKKSHIVGRLHSYISYLTFRAGLGVWREGRDRSTLPQMYFDNNFPIVMGTSCFFLWMWKGLEPEWDLSLTTLSISIKIGKDMEKKKFTDGWQESKLIKSFLKITGAIRYSPTRAYCMTLLLSLYSRKTLPMCVRMYLKNGHGHIVLKNKTNKSTKKRKTTYVCVDVRVGK